MKNAKNDNSFLFPWTTSPSRMTTRTHRAYHAERPTKTMQKCVPSPWVAQVLAVVVAFVFLLPECFARFENPRFSRDERSLAFDYCEKTCRLVVYSLENGAAVSLSPKDKQEAWINPAFALSSDLLAFVISRSPTDVQIATIHPNGSNLKILTSSATIKRSPNFSPDGRTIIFSGAEQTMNEKGHGARWDVYLVERTAGNERRLTDLQLYSISAPFFLPDGARFTFSASGSAVPRSRVPASVIDLERLFPNRKVFVFPLEGPQELKPFVQGLHFASLPMPIQSGELAVLVRVNEIDNIKAGHVYDLFLATPEGAKRHTSFHSYVRSYGISKTGGLVAYVTTGQDGKYESMKLMLWRKKSGASVEVRMPALRTIDVFY